MPFDEDGELARHVGDDRLLQRFAAGEVGHREVTGQALVAAGCDFTVVSLLSSFSSTVTAVVVRVWNASSRPATPTITLGFDVKRAALADMLERDGRALGVRKGAVKLPKLAPKEIVTLMLWPAKRGARAPTLHIVPWDTDGHCCW